MPNIHYTSRRKQTFNPIRGQASDNLYFNIEFTNNNQVLEPIRYSAIRTRNILDKADEYYMSVIRFNIPSYYVPLLVWEYRSDSTTESEYSVTLTQGADSHQQYLIIDTQNYPSTLSSNSNRWVYNFQVIIDALNAALLSAFNVVKPPAAEFPPYVTYNPVTQLFRLWFDSFYLPESGNPIELWFNAPLFTLFNSFYHQLNMPSNQFDPEGKDVRILTENLNGTNQAIFNPVMNTYAYYNEQEYITTYNWNPFKRIVITYIKCTYTK